MATFTGQLISATYDAILKTVDNDPIGAAAKQITDGLGNVTPLYISTTQIGIGITPTEVLHVSGNIKATGTLTIDSDATIDGNISFDSLTGIGVAVTINKFVSQADGIASNDNDSTLPTSAAVKDYVDTKAALTDTLEEVLALGNITNGNDIAVSSGDNITLTDFSKILIGASNDLQLYHSNPTGSFVQHDGTGNLHLTTSNDFILENSNRTKTIIDSTIDAEVNLYFNNAKKLETTNTGILVTGTVTGDVVGNLTGNVAGNITGTVNATSDLADGVTATTQPTGDNSIKVATTAYVDSTAGLTDTLEEVLALGNTTGGTNISITAGDKITTFESTGIDDNATSTALTIDSSQNSSFAGNVTINKANPYITLNDSSAANQQLTITQSGSTANFQTRGGASSQGQFIFKQTDGTTSSNALIINQQSNATFIGTVTAPTFLGDLTGTVNGTSDLADGVTATTQSANDASTKVATTAYADAAATAVPIGNYLPLAGGTLTGNLLMGNTVVNPVSGFSDQAGIGLKYSTTVPELQVSSDSIAMELGRTSTGGDGDILALRKAGSVIHTFRTNNISIGTDATFAGNLDFSTNNTDISMTDSAGAITRMLILNSANTSYIGPVDAYAGGGMIYGAAVGVSSHTFNVGGVAQLTVAASNATFAGNVVLDGSNQIQFLPQAGESNTEAMRITRSSDKMYFTYGTNAGDEAFYIKSDGDVIFEENVGIGGGLNITGTNNTTSTLTLTNTAPTPDNSWSLTPQYNSQDLHLLEDTTTQVTFKSGGNVTFAGGLIGTYATFGGIVTGQVNSNTFGTASASGRALIVQSGSSNQAIMLKNNLGGDGTILATGTATSMNYQFNTYSTGNALFIQNDGNVGINQTPSATSSYFVALQIGEQVNLFGHTDGVGAGSATHLSNNITHNGGYKYINNDTGCLYTQAGGNHTFGTFVAGTAGASATEQRIMRITSGGDVLFRATSVPSASNLIGSGFKYDSKSRMTLVQASDNNNLTDIQEYFNTDGAVGKIQTSGSATIFNTNSDYRLKEDLQDFKGLEMVSKIPVYDFKWKTNGRRSYGVMAHELQEILPDAAAGKKDAINEDGSINPQGVDYSKIVPLLVKSIQELKAEVDLLKSNKCNCK